MRYPFRVGLLVLSGLAIHVATASPAVAAETTSSDIVLIREGDVVHDDLYAAAVTVRVIGTVDGDLVAFAADQVVIDGTVTGSLTVVAPRVTVNGSVSGSVRAVAGELTITGEIGADVVLVAAEASLTPGSLVGGDLLAWVYRLSALGSIGGDISGSQRRMDLAGSVGGNVDVDVGRLRIVDDLTVEGDLGYRSDREAEGLESASVSGSIVRKEPMPPNLRVRALGLFARILAVLFVAIASVTIVWSAPDRSAAAAARVSSGPLRNWLYGAAFFFSPVVVGLGAWLILTLAPPIASLPLLALALPLMLALMGLLLVVALGAGVPVAIRVGKRLNRSWSQFSAALAGSVLLGVVWCLPVVGWLVPLVTLPWGLGAWLRSGSTQSS